MIRKIATITFQSGALVALLGSLLFAGGVLGSSPGILGSSLRFIAAICRDSSTQWMVMACLASHFMTLLMVERRMNLAPSATGVTDLKSGCEDEESGQSEGATELSGARGYSSAPLIRKRYRSRSGGISTALQRVFCCPGFWLSALIIVVGLRYAWAYQTAAHHLEFLVLLAGIVVGKGLAIWVRWPGASGTRVRDPQSIHPPGRQVEFMEETVTAHAGALAAAEEGVRRGARGGRAPQFFKGAALPGQPGTVIAPPSAGEVLRLREPCVGGLAALRPGWPDDNVARRRVGVTCVLVTLLAASALWQPVLGMTFQYHELHRWSGVWDNPNVYGLLMGGGLVLAVGLAFAIFRSRRGNEAPIRTGSKPPSAFAKGMGDQHVACYAFIRVFGGILCVFAAALLGVGLWHGYSRGAWVATVGGVVYLLGSGVWGLGSGQEGDPTSPRPSPSRSGGTEREKVGISRIPCISWLKLPAFLLCSLRSLRLNRNWLWGSVILASVGVLCFWQFRFSEAPVARRVFSAANINDFSWRNRVVAWEGAVRMMWDRPLTGVGWGQAEAVYAKKYLPSRLTEGGAFGLNDYLMLGTSAGVPALLCFSAYIWLSLRRRPDNESRDPSFDLLSVTCRAGAVVLLIGFWFDGGLF